MTYNVVTATDYIDFLDQTIQVLTSRHVATVAINNAGTGGTYVAGDILGIDNTGATQTHIAQIEVIAVAAGQITVARIYRGGAYTVDPTTTTANAATGGGGTGATFDITLAPTGWTQLARESEIDATPTVAAGGAGYSVSDVLTLVGGVVAEGGAAATMTVATLGATDVATVTILTRGDYEVYPTGNILTTVSPSGGSGCTLNATWRDTTGDTVVVLQGDAGASIAPIVGIKTYSDVTDESSVNTVYNWALFGMTSWGASLGLHDQPNVSPGFNTAAGDGTLTISTSGDGAFFPLKNADAFNIDFEIRATGRSVTIVARVEGASTVYYPQISFGLLNQMGVTTEFPFPAYVAGSSDRRRCWYRDTGSVFGGISEVISRNNGPMFVWAPEGAWLEAKNSSIASNTSTAPGYATENITPRVQVWPLGPCNAHGDLDDQLFTLAPAAGFDNDDLTLASSPISIYRTPDTGGDLFPLFPVTIVQSDVSSGRYRVFGEIDGAWWFHTADAAVSSGDRHAQGGAHYSIVQNGTRVQPFSFLALREN